MAAPFAQEHAKVKLTVVAHAKLSAYLESFITPLRMGWILDSQCLCASRPHPQRIRDEAGRNVEQDV